MAVSDKLRTHLRQLLREGEARGRGSRPEDDARRLWERTRRLLAMNLVPPQADKDALELACMAMHLPGRQPAPAGRLGQTGLRDRAEQAAELLISAVADLADEATLDRATRILQELHHREPALEEARLLADAVNLDDFGVVGFVLQTMQAARGGGDVTQLAEGCRKREQYGYWEARLKDGFHFEPVRQIARRRLQNAMGTARMLLDELKEDQGS